MLQSKTGSGAGLPQRGSASTTTRQTNVRALTSGTSRKQCNNKQRTILSKRARGSTLPRIQAVLGAVRWWTLPRYDTVFTCGRCARRGMATKQHAFDASPHCCFVVT